MGSKSVKKSLIFKKPYLYNMLSRLWLPPMLADTPLTVMMVGPTWWACRGGRPTPPFCLARAWAKADLCRLRWLLAVSLMSLPVPVVELPASEEVSLPWRIQSSSASWRISEKRRELSSGKLVLIFRILDGCWVSQQVDFYVQMIDIFCGNDVIFIAMLLKLCKLANISWNQLID